MIPESMLKYWEEIIDRDDPQAAWAELPVMVQHVGLYRVYDQVIKAERKAQDEARGR